MAKQTMLVLRNEEQKFNFWPKLEAFLLQQNYKVASLFFEYHKFHIQQQFQCVSWRHLKEITNALQPVTTETFLSNTYTQNQLRNNIVKQLQQKISRTVINWTIIDKDQVCAKCKHIIHISESFKQQTDGLKNLQRRNTLTSISVYNVTKLHKLFFDQVSKEICTVFLD